MIIWLEDPRAYRYLRKSGGVIRRIRRGFKKGTKLKWENFYKLVGYELVMHDDYLHFFYYQVYWLKDYDYGCPEANSVGAYSDGIGQPSEGKLVADLLKENAEKMNAEKANPRCLDCKRKGSQRRFCILKEDQFYSKAEGSDYTSIGKLLTELFGSEECDCFVPVDKNYMLALLRDDLRN